MVGWYYDENKPDEAGYWNGSEWTQVRYLRDLQTSSLYSTKTGQRIPEEEMPSGLRRLPVQPVQGSVARTGRRSEGGAANSQRRGFGCLGVVGLIVLVSFMISAVGGDSSGDAPNEVGAQSVCEDVIKQNLKAPSTAELDHVGTVQQDNIFKVTTLVDAENSFGATMRSEYTCRVIWYPSREQWKLDLLEHR